MVSIGRGHSRSRDKPRLYLQAPLSHHVTNFRRLNEAFLPVFFFVISVLLHAPNSDTLKTLLTKAAVCYVGLPFTCRFLRAPLLLKRIVSLLQPLCPCTCEIIHSFVQDVCLGARDLAEHEKVRQHNSTSISIVVPFWFTNKR